MRRTIALSLVLLLVAAWAGCTQSPGLPGVVANGGDGGSGGGEEPLINLGEEKFRELQANLVSECASCHKIGGMADTPFLGAPDTGDPDPYEAITSWPGIVVANPDKSVLITWPSNGGHSGTASSPGLEAELLEWLALEADALDDVADEPKPTIPPFKPITGFNAVYLDPLGAEFAGMSITFEAEELTESILALNEMTVIPTADQGVSLEHPLLSVYAPGSTEADPDPVDSFSNVVQEFAAGASGDLGPGSVILTNWISGGKLSLNFLNIKALAPGIGGPTGACGALAEFEANALPALQGNCSNCHGGNNQTATNALDMSDLGSDSAAACGQILNRVSLTSPADSQLFITTDPNGNASHPFKFGGNQNSHTDFVNTVTTWLQAEAQ